MNIYLPGNFPDYGKLVLEETNYTVKKRYDLLSLIPKDTLIKSVLELGCADGKNLNFFKEFYNINKEHTVGIDNFKSLNIDKNKKFKFIHKTAENFLSNNKSKFDLILFSDVLEHIYNPWKILKDSKSSFSKNGLGLISIPNFQNLNYIRALINGNFYYSKTGLFDETHIRFFSINTILEYLKNLNFKIIKTGWREDTRLNNLKEVVLKKLNTKDSIYIEFEEIKIQIKKEDVEKYFSQQILICFSNG